MGHEIVVTRTEDLTQVCVTGDLTVRNAQEIAAVFRDIDGENIMIELLQPSAIDLSFLQIFISRTNTLKQQGSRIETRITLRDADVKLLTNTGVYHLLQTNTI